MIVVHIYRHTHEVGQIIRIEISSILDWKCPAGHTPARIINTSPEKGDITIRERSIGFQLQCYAKGTPTPTITFKRGKDHCVLINLNIKL